MIIPIGENGVELATVSAATEPQTQGWYVGRNEATLHEAITVSRKICGVKNFRFTTLLIPVKVGEKLPSVTWEEGDITVEMGEKTYRIKMD
jgi:hypothetical protein